MLKSPSLLVAILKYPGTLPVLWSDVFSGRVPPVGAADRQRLNLLAEQIHDACLMVAEGYGTGAARNLQDARALVDEISNATVRQRAAALHLAIDRIFWAAGASET